MINRIAVLGAGGFIGNRTVEMFCLGSKYEVRPVVREARALAMASRFALDGRIADGRDRVALTSAFEGCDAVIHAIAGDPATILGALEPVYRAAEASGVRRLIYLSSASVHGQAPAQGVTEATPLTDRQPIAYNNAKVRAEWRLQEMRQSGNVELVILRPGIVHGPRAYWTGGFVDELLAGDAYLIDGGKGICNGAYVDNVVHAITCALETEAKHADRQAYLIGDAETFTWADLVRPLARAVGFALDDLPEPVFDASPGIFTLLKNSDPVQGMMRRLPRALRVALRAGYREFRTERGQDAGGTPGPKRPVATQERALLHRCAWKFPHGKAATEIGYSPPISFSEAQHRTLGWLDFAGYPIIA